MSSNRTISPQEVARQAIEILSSTDATRLHFRTRIDFFEKKIEQWNTSSWRVGLIGITSSGKSMLVNGLLGEDLLPSHVKPSSNCLIMTRHGKEKKVVKYYENGKVQDVTSNLKWELDELGNELKNPTNKKKIRHLSVYSPDFKLNQNITLCDTPGLDAYNLPHHDEITINSILPSLDLVLYISHVRLAPQENNRIVKLISEAKKPIVWVLNCVDVIKEKTERDGIVSKSRNQVLSEYLKKVQDNLHNSGVTDPSAVPIVFVSSIQALKPSEYDQSGFEEFITALHELICKLEPKFTHGRLKQISNELSYLLEAENQSEAGKEEDYKKDKNEYHEQKKVIESTRKNTTKDFDLICSKFDSKARKLMDSLQHLSNSSIDEANHLKSQAQKCISEANQRLNRLIIEMNEEFKRIGKQNNILNEDFFHRLSSSAPTIQFPPVEVDETKIIKQDKKDGFIEWCARKLGSLLNKKHWGYYVYEETVLEIKDIEEFKSQLDNGLISEMNWLMDSREQSISALENYCQTVINVIESRICSIEEALRHIIPKQTRSWILKQLQSLKDSIDKNALDHPIKHESTKSKNPIISDKNSQCEPTLEIDDLELSMLRFLNSAANRIYQMHFDILCGYDPVSVRSRVVFCHWNQTLFSDFWLRYFPHDSVPHGHYAKTKSGKYEFTIIDDSQDDRKDYDNILRNIDWQNSSLFLLIPVSQIGYFQKQFFQSKAAKHFKKAKKLISVIADFSDFLDNGNLVDYLYTFSEFLINSGLKSDRIVINHDDLGLGSVIETLIKRKYGLGNERDEIEFIAKMDSEGYLLNVDIKNRIAHILPEWRNYINDKRCHI